MKEHKFVNFVIILKYFLFTYSNLQGILLFCGMWRNLAFRNADKVERVSAYDSCID